MALGKRDLSALWLILSLTISLFAYSMFSDYLPSNQRNQFCRYPIVDTEEITSIHLTTKGNIVGIGQIYNFNDKVNSSWPLFQTLPPFPNQQMLDPYFIAKFDSEMHLIWSRLLTSDESRGFIASSVDKDENIYLFGEGSPSSFQNYSFKSFGLPRAIQRYFIIKLSADGEIEWITKLGATHFENFRILIDEVGNVVLSGITDFTLPPEQTVNLEEELLPTSRNAFIHLDQEGNAKAIIEIGSQIEISDVEFSNDTVTFLSIELTDQQLMGNKLWSIRVTSYSLSKPTETMIKSEMIGILDDQNLQNSRIFLSNQGTIIDGYFSITPTKITKWHLNGSFSEVVYRRRQGSSAFGFSSTKITNGLMVRVFARNGIVEFSSGIAIRKLVQEKEGSSAVLLFDSQLNQKEGIIFPSLFTVPRPLVMSDGNSIVIAGRTNDELIEFTAGFKDQIDGFFDPLLLHIGRDQVYGSFIGGTGLKMEFCY